MPYHRAVGNCIHSAEGRWGVQTSGNGRIMPQEIQGLWSTECPAQHEESHGTVEGVSVKLLNCRTDEKPNKYSSMETPLMMLTVYIYQHLNWSINNKLSRDHEINNRHFILWQKYLLIVMDRPWASLCVCMCVCAYWKCLFAVSELHAIKLHNIHKIWS